jgi:hypothetical protein
MINPSEFTVRLEEREREAQTILRAAHARALSVAPGKEEELRRLRSWLAFSERLDRAIEASEPVAAPPSAERSLVRPQPLSAHPQPVLSSAPAGARVEGALEGRAPRKRGRLPARRGVRAALAGRLARLAVALHREAAGEAVKR